MVATRRRICALRVGRRPGAGRPGTGPRSRGAKLIQSTTNPNPSAGSQPSAGFRGRQEQRPSKLKLDPFASDEVRVPPSGELLDELFDEFGCDAETLLRVAMSP
jgi:hypothetical protein